MGNKLNMEPNDKDIELEKLCTDSVELIHYSRYYLKNYRESLEKDFQKTL